VSRRAGWPRRDPSRLVQYSITRYSARLKRLPRQASFGQMNVAEGSIASFCGQLLPVCSEADIRSVRRHVANGPTGDCRFDYSITSSARGSSDCGTESRAPAVLRLMTSSLLRRCLSRREANDLSSRSGTASGINNAGQGCPRMNVCLDDQAEILGRETIPLIADITRSHEQWVMDLRAVSAQERHS